MMEIVIIGGGPAGTYTGMLLAQKGHSVNIYEEHKEIGVPWNCTGIFTADMTEFFDVSKVLKRELGEFEIKCNESVNLSVKNNFIVERAGLDKLIAKKAKQAGAKIHLNHKYIENSKNEAVIKDLRTKKTIKKKFDVLIGADGPASAVEKNNFGQKRTYFSGIQCRTKFNHNDKIHIHPHVGCFGWIVPESKNVARIGIMAEKNANNIFKRFLDELGIKKVIDYQGGPIPKYDPKFRIKKDNIVLIGDAATQVKATTGGGIIPSFKAARVLAENIDDLDRYECKELDKSLKRHLLASKILNRFSELDWDELIYKVKSPKVKKIIETRDREKFEYLLKLILAKPSLLKYSVKLFKSSRGC